MFISLIPTTYSVVIGTILSEIIILIIDTDSVLIGTINIQTFVFFPALDREQAAQLIIMFLWTKMVSVLMHCKP